MDSYHGESCLPKGQAFLLDCLCFKSIQASYLVIMDMDDLSSRPLALVFWFGKYAAHFYSESAHQLPQPRVHLSPQSEGGVLVEQLVPVHLLVVAAQSLGTLFVFGGGL